MKKSVISHQLATTMISKVLFFFLVLLSVGLFNYYDGVEGSTSRRRSTLSDEETAAREKDFDLELERQLKLIHKHPIKTINAGQNGDTFYCVDIHEQPALDHPLLKNHKIQMRPNSRPKGVDENKNKKSFGIKAKYSMENNSSSTILKPLDCPEGTVPIRRTTKEDLIKAKQFFKSYTPTSTTSTRQASNSYEGQHVAIRRSKSNETYYGVFGWLNLANPSYVLNDQFSAGQVWIETGELYKITSLQAGWAVSPQLFQDNKTRLFVYSSNSNVNPDGCYNLLCQGFVHTNKDIALGQELTPSVYNGEQHILTLQIYKDEIGGSWWLAIGEPENDQMKEIGYWPGELYTELVNGASSVAWGGLVQGNSKGQSPSMGNGYTPRSSLEYKTVCSIMQLQVIYSNFTFVPPNESALENFVYHELCYGLYYSGFLGKMGFGYSFLYGGPGGNNCGD